MGPEHGFVKVATTAEVPEGRGLQVLLNGQPVGLYQVDGAFFALGDICSHEQAFLSEGEVFGGEVECPRHGAVFDVKTGQALTLPATRPVPRYELKVEGDDILVRPLVESTT